MSDTPKPPVPPLRATVADLAPFKPPPIEADLGAGLLKKRIARPGEGKRGGFRTLVATNRAGRWFFVFGFPKNERGSIDRDEEEALKKLAAHLLSLSASALAAARQAGELMEIDCDAQDAIGDS